MGDVMGLQIGAGELTNDPEASDEVANSGYYCFVIAGDQSGNPIRSRIIICFHAHQELLVSAPPLSRSLYQMHCYLQPATSLDCNCLFGDRTGSNHNNPNLAEFVLGYARRQ